MAFSRSCVVSLLLLALLAAYAAELFTVQAAESTTGIRTSLIDCGSACADRCRLSSRPNLCQRACGTCCYRCNCVPPGTYGNKEVCPCYANMKTHGGRPKCP
ncbi:hypothetical protein Taro_001052 [Colocasia esculenta]|uniref:Snakin-2 n=1 Tax=Colocasia esculenta TaxID=4460 RepID=A0A843TDM9_COLES|nr:hypothetical protein [Colocasia esculenta]